MSLEIGRYISFALGEKNAPELHEMTGGRVSPVIMPQDGTGALPWIWYYSSNMFEDSTKDGPCGDNCEVIIEVVAASYEQLLVLLASVRKAMSQAFESWQGEQFDVVGQTFHAGPEEYDDVLQAYCRKINYQIETY